MRRSAAIPALALVLALAAGSASDSPASAGGPAPSTLTVGIWADPASSVAAGLWIAEQLVLLLTYVDEGFDHLKDDVRRRLEHPQQQPQVVPYGPPPPPELLPIRRSARHPAPIPDSLPLRSIS